MSEERWSEDITYAFSIHRIFLGIFGLWPLQTKTVFTRIQWVLSMIAQFMILPFALMDFTGDDRNAAGNIESILFFVATTIAMTKSVCIAFNQKKLGTNIDAAIDDWLFAKNNEKTREIMKKYAFKSRVLTFVLLYAGLGCFSTYVLAIVMINVKQIFSTDTTSMDVNTNTTNWIFLIPCGSLSTSVTASQYTIILIIQIFQLCSMCTMQCFVDSFYFNITVHLAGQLEVLQNRFKTFAKESNTNIANYRQEFINLINRHSELMGLNQNLEDSFHFLILCQLVIITIMLSLLGLRLNWCVKENNLVEFTKSALVMNYLLIESLVYTYGGDFLQTESEGIFYALYATSWFTLPLALMKDLHFAMMRSSFPFRLTGGKFFYVNRETMMYILKTAASYVSVLRIALRD